MSIPFTSSFGLMRFNRPMSILARPRHVPRVKAATARLGTPPFPTKQFFHANTKNFQTPTDTQMDRYIPNFSSLPAAEKLTAIQSLKREKEKDPNWKPGAYKQLAAGLARKEKEIRDANRWYKKVFRVFGWVFRVITFGPRMVILIIVSLLDS